MLWFLLKLFLAFGCGVGAVFLRRTIASEQSAERRRDNLPLSVYRFGALGLVALSALFVMYALVGTSVVWVSSGHIATLQRVYFGSALPPGKIVATSGEMGPQARMLTAGFHIEPFVTITHVVDTSVEVFTVPNGKCALLSAKDGQPIRNGAAFAAPWTDDAKQRMINDAEFFLGEGKGERGPQTTVLTPGSYTINPFLWEEPQLLEATRIEQGTVGVVKSSVRAAVDFGAFKRALSPDGKLKVLTSERLPKQAASTLLVPVGDVGVWEEALPNGLYYINIQAYKITMVPTIAQVFEYKGGYKRRTVDVSVDDQGRITDKVEEKEIQPVPESADTAIFAKPEGWDVAQELRVLAQVSPELAPFVAASLGLTGANTAEVIENRVVTPIIRSVIRDVLGGAQIPIKQQKAVLDAEGNPILGDDGSPKTSEVNEFRPVKVMDLLENRSSLEAAMESEAKPEALKEGVTIMEIRLSESAIPAELLFARKREQLAQQLTKAWKQEQLAQTQRQETEKARALAEQQPELVTAEIKAQAAEEKRKARETEGKGEEAYLTAIADGQRAQAEVLGEEVTAQLQMFTQLLNTVTVLTEKNPDLLESALTNASKFVPNIVVNNGGDGGGGSLEGAAAIFGHLTSQGAATKKDAPAAEPPAQN